MPRSSVWSVNKGFKGIIGSEDVYNGEKRF